MGVKPSRWNSRLLACTPSHTAASCCSLLHRTLRKMKLCALNSPPQQPIAARLTLPNHQSRSCCQGYNKYPPPHPVSQAPCWTAQAPIASCKKMEAQSSQEALEFSTTLFLLSRALMHCYAFGNTSVIFIGQCRSHYTSLNPHGAYWWIRDWIFSICKLNLAFFRAKLCLFTMNLNRVYSCFTLFTFKIKASDHY